MDDYSNNPKLLTLKSPTKIVPTNIETVVTRRTRATGSNVIRNKALNNALNRYINQHASVLYYLRFNAINHKDYVAIGFADAYDRKRISGYFYRDTYLVVLYSTEKITNKSIIGSDSFKPTSDIAQTNYRHAPLKFFLEPQVKFEIYPSGKLRLIDKNEAIYAEI